jgi:hypothetical protein
MSMKHSSNDTDSRNEVLGEKPVPVVICPTQISHGQAEWTGIAVASFVWRDKLVRINGDSARFEPFANRIQVQGVTAPWSQETSWPCTKRLLSFIRSSSNNATIIFTLST